MAEAGNDDDPFPGHNSAAGDGDVLLNSSNEETRALLRRIETLEKSVKVTGSALAKSGIDLDLTPVPDEDSKELTSTAYTDNERSLLGRWADKRQSIWKFEEYKLPESTYTLLITEPVFSLGFLIGVVAFGIAVLSLSLVLIAEWDNTSPDNRFGVPAGVNTEVQIVQYLSVVIGVLMETVRLFSMNVVPSPAEDDLLCCGVLTRVSRVSRVSPSNQEVPLGLEILGKEIEQYQLRRRPFNRSRVFFSCALRLIVGYMFLFSLCESPRLCVCASSSALTRIIENMKGS